MKEKGSGCKCNQNIASTNHRDDRNHRIGVRQCIKVDPIGNAKEHGDENDVRSPLKWSGFFPTRIPKEEQDEGHDEALVDIEPNLYGHNIQIAHQIFVVQATERP